MDVAGIGRAGISEDVADVHLALFFDQDFGGRFVLDAEENEGVEVAEHLRGIGLVAEACLKIGGSLGIGGNRDVGTTGLVERGNEVLVRRFIGFVDVDADRAVAARARNVRQPLAAPFLVNPPVLRGEVGKHGGADGACHFLIRQRIQPDIDNAAGKHDAGPIEDIARGVEKIGGNQLRHRAGGHFFEEGIERGDQLGEVLLVGEEGFGQRLRGVALQVGERQPVGVVLEQQVTGDGIAVAVDAGVVVHEAGGTALFRLLQPHDFLIACEFRLIAGHLLAEQLVDQADVERLQVLAVLLD